MRACVNATPPKKCEWCREGLSYRCASCWQTVPWCFGGADARIEVCDACWCQLETEQLVIGGLL